METIYGIKKGTYHINPEVEEVLIESKTEKFFKRVGRSRRDAFETSYEKFFLDKKSAIEYMRNIRIKELESALKSVKGAEITLEKFNEQYPKG